MPQSKLSIFNSKQLGITAETITNRLESMRKVSDFKCTTDAHRKARYALFKNMAQYESAFKVLQNMVIQEHEDHLEFRREKIKLMKEYGAEEKYHEEFGTYFDEEGITDKAIYRSQLRQLESEFEEAIEKEEERLAENKKLSKMEIEDVPEPYMTNIDNFPDSVSPRELAGISFMIKDPSDGKDNK